MNGIKSEGDSSSIIKPDPELKSEHDDEEDKYADEEGELHITDGKPGVWLAKLPKWLWEVWADIADDDEIVLGKMRIYNKPAKDRDNPKICPKIKLLLNDLPGGQHAKVPKNYDITLNRDEYANTVIFSEKDQPGFKAWRPNRVFRKEDRQARRDEAYRINKNKNPNKRYSSAIPKHVALEGRVVNEATVTAVENEEYRRLNDLRFKEMFTPKLKTVFEPGYDKNHAPAVAASQSISTWTMPSSYGKSAKKKKQTEKAVRMSQEDLLDRLTECFKRYKYWPLRALRQDLHQPESYIKTSLEKIATLVRSGPFAMTYRLNPEYERSIKVDPATLKEEAAVVNTDDDLDDDLDDDDSDGDDDNFEDVKMEEG